MSSSSFSLLTSAHKQCLLAPCSSLRYQKNLGFYVTTEFLVFSSYKVLSKFYFLSFLFHMELQRLEQLDGQPLESVSTLYQTSFHAEIQLDEKFENNLKEIELKCVDQCNHIQQFNHTQLVKAPEGAVVQDTDLTVRDDGGGMVDVEVKFGTMSNRKRGRPPRASPVKPKKLRPPPSQRRKKDEEDVCFICFDGGSLVICDRR